MKTTIREQALLGVEIIESLFIGGMPPVPKEATVNSLWAEICRMKGRVKKPKKVEAIRLLLEDERLAGLNTALIADIIKRVFHRHGLNCNTTDASIRWYISQKTLEWRIIPRLKRTIETEIEE